MRLIFVKQIVSVLSEGNVFFPPFQVMGFYRIYLRDKWFSRLRWIIAPFILRHYVSDHRSACWADGLQNNARERESRNPGQWSTRRGSIVNPTLLVRKEPEGMANRRRIDGEKLFAVYVASEGYTWCAVRGAPTGDFLFLRFLLSSVPRNIHLSTSLVTRCVTAEMIRTCQNGETGGASLLNDEPPFRPMDHARIYFLEIPGVSASKNVRTPDFPAPMYRNVFRIIQSMISRERRIKNCEQFGRLRFKYWRLIIEETELIGRWDLRKIKTSRIRNKTLELKVLNSIFKL